MKRRAKVILQVVCMMIVLTQIQPKNYLIYTVNYALSQQKPFSMHTVELHDQKLPAFIMFTPSIEIQGQDRTGQMKNSPSSQKQDIEKQKQRLQSYRKRLGVLNFHKKLQIPMKVVIQHRNSIETECIIDQPWDLCVIENPNKALQFSIHCLVVPGIEQVGKACKGQAIIRQAGLRNISPLRKKSQQKIKYESGLFSIPSSNRHSLMLITCQDDDLTSFSQSLKIFSNIKYHRYERQNIQETKQLVGFDRTEFADLSKDKALPFPGAAGKVPQKTSSKTAQTMADPLQPIRNYVYLDVQQVSVRKCLQFQYYHNDLLINGEQVVDYVNVTDTEYRNIYDVIPRYQLEVLHIKDDKQKPLTPTTLQKQMSMPSFQHNMEITLDVFKPFRMVDSQQYDIRVKLLNKQNLSMIVVEYLFPIAINGQSAMAMETSIYSRSNHFRFMYVVGNQVINGVKALQIEIDFQPRQKGKDTNSNNFFFIKLSVQDMQNIVVQKLQTTFLSVKKGQQLTFLIQEPYEFSQIMTQDSQKTASDLVQIKTSTDILKKRLSEYSSNHEHISECHFSKGCKFQLQALDDCLNCKIEYKTSFIKGSDDMVFIQAKNERLLGKIDLDEIQYFYKQLKPQKVVQFIINTPNIIVYTLDTAQKIKECNSTPKKSCHSQIATSHQMIILHNQDKQNPQKIYFAVQGLDKTRFTITLIESQKLISVMNGQAFSYKIPQGREQLQLLFNIPQFDPLKQYDRNITFNLISPLNSLQMDIVQLDLQSEKQLQTMQLVKTMSGYIKIASKQIRSPRIKIVLRKTLHYTQHSVHFTLVVSTSDHKYRLDNGITHYQTFDAAQQKTFIIEFQDRQQYQFNLHFFDTEEDEVAFNVAIYNPSGWKGKDRDLNFEISANDFTISLNEEIIDQNDLCPQNDPQCTIFLIISSSMTHEVQVSMTLLTSDSVIQLKDGVWQDFKLGQLLLRSHFYFVPTHQDNPVKIFFKSTNPAIFMSAVLYDNSNNANPAEWSFPDTHDHGQQQQGLKDDQQSQQQFKSSHLIQVDNEDPQYKKCFPNCVVLLSIIQTASQSLLQAEKQSQSLSILASNNQLELPQKMRLSLELKEDEEQFVFVNLRHAFKEKKELLTFFTNLIVGYASVYANVYVPSMQNIPDKQDYQILFQPIKTQISLDQIEHLFMQDISQLSSQVQSVDDMFQTQQLYLALLIQAHENTKMTIQFTTELQQIRQLQIDTTQTIYLEQDQERIYQFIPTRDQKIKFIRNKGNALFHQFKCQSQGYDRCLKSGLDKLRVKAQTDIRNLKIQADVQNKISEYPRLTDKKMKQMAQLSEQQHFSQYQVLKRTQTQHVIQCQRCIVFIWVYAMQPAQLTIQLQTLNTQVSLKENEVISDYLQPNQYHRYYLPRVQKEPTTIVVSVNEGSPVVTVNDNLSFEETKKASQMLGEGRKVVLFVVPPIKALQTSKSNTKQQTKTSSFNKIFSNLHISISSEDAKPVSYSITYSSGTHEMSLQTGMISSHFLFKNQPTVLYYKNQNKQQKTYLTLTVQSNQDQLQKILNGIQIKIYALIPNKVKNKVQRNQFSSQRPSSRKNWLKKQTTLTYQMPPFEDIQIDVLSQFTTKITVGISSNQVVFLPLSYQYPLFLKPKQEMKFIIENLQQSFLQLVVKKCDQSNPYIFYTNDQDEFKKDMYSNYDRFGGENIFRHVSKTKAKGALYVKIKADPKEKSVLMISGRYVDLQDTNYVDIDPGNMGIINYQFTSLNQVKLSIVGLQCGKQCGFKTEYFLVRSKSLPKIYSEMVCAGQQMMQLFETAKPAQKDSLSNAMVKMSETIQLQKIPLKPDVQTNQLSFQIPITGQFNYVTIKAVYTVTGEEVYYKPVEIKTLQANVKNYSSNVLYWIGGVALGMVLLLVYTTHKLARKGYMHVGQDETMIA